MSIRALLKECVGKTAVTDNEIENGAGQVIPAGTRVRITGVGRGVNIQTKPCPCCGCFIRVRGIRKSSLTLVDE